MAGRRMIGCQIAALVLLAGVVVLVIGAVWGGATLVQRWGDGRRVATFAGMLRQWEQVRTAWAGVVESVDREPKLVVLQTSITVFVRQTSEKRALWNLLDLGDTVVEIRAEDNRVQYVVPLRGFGADDVAYDPEHRRLTVTVPAPELDRDMVAVQSDPGKLHVRTAVGWARLPASGEALERQARQELRRVVIRYGRSEHLELSARVNAEAVLRDRLFAPLAAALDQQDIELAVRFRE